MNYWLDFLLSTCKFNHFFPKWKRFNEKKQLAGVSKLLFGLIFQVLFNENLFTIDDEDALSGLVEAASLEVEDAFNFCSVGGDFAD